MDPRTFLNTAITPALRMLPAAMQGDRALALQLAIAQQETQLYHRRQLERGPGRSFYSFEIEFISEVLNHPASSAVGLVFVNGLQYPPGDDDYLMQAVEFDSVLASGLARLGLWRDPAPLPDRTQPDLGWAYYIRTWAPGMPRPADWAANWARAWAALG